jgi:hypothetical protein
MGGARGWMWVGSRSGGASVGVNAAQGKSAGRTGPKVPAFTATARKRVHAVLAHVGERHRRAAVAVVGHVTRIPLRRPML